MVSVAKCFLSFDFDLSLRKIVWDGFDSAVGRFGIWAEEEPCLGRLPGPLNGISCRGPYSLGQCEELDGTGELVLGPGGRWSWPALSPRSPLPLRLSSLFAG